MKRLIRAVTIAMAIVATPARATSRILPPEGKELGRTCQNRKNSAR
ncbi:hypothetical protein [Ruegeria sp. MALMAid1280]